jgi:hypothetical protein
MNNIQIDIQIIPSVINEVSVQREEGTSTGISLDDIDLSGDDSNEITDNDNKC